MKIHTVRKLLLLVPILLLCACTSVPLVQQSDAQLEANKQLVLDMWHDVIDGRNIDAARKYIATDYQQNSPSLGSGVEALITFLHTEFPNSEPLKPGTYPLTEFEFVLAEGDLVQLMFQRQLPNSSDPAELKKVWWYDTYRVKDGMIVEHWDSAQE